MMTTIVIGTEQGHEAYEEVLSGVRESGPRFDPRAFECDRDQEKQIYGDGGRDGGFSQHKPRSPASLSTWFDKPTARRQPRDDSNCP
jgi:hypothetical protein